MEATGGWATALLVAASVGIVDRPGGSDLIGPPMRRLVDTLSERDRGALIELAHLPFVSPELCDRVAGAGGALERFVDAGVPLARTGSGWWELPSPVADYLAGLGPIGDASVLVAAQTSKCPWSFTSLRTLNTRSGRPRVAATVAVT